MKAKMADIEKRLQVLGFIWSDARIKEGQTQVFHHIMPYGHVYLQTSLYATYGEYVETENMGIEVMVIFPFGRRVFVFADAFLPLDALLEEINGTHEADEFKEFLTEQMEKIHDSYWIYYEAEYEYMLFEVNRWLDMAGASVDADEAEVLQSWSYYLHDQKDMAYRNWHQPGVS